MKYGTGEYIIKPSSARYSSAYNAPLQRVN